MLRVIRSDSTEPYYNLALEEILFRRCENRGDFTLYLWQNQNTVVIGRNQNIYVECNLAYANQKHTAVVRRQTGGGTVFHDLGNLNFTILVPRQCYDKKRTAEIIVNALRKLGIRAQLNGRNDMTLDGFKFSGSAYYITERAGLHHGTLMLNVDLTEMEKLLETPKGKLNRTGIDSVRSRVVNLIDRYPNIRLEDLKLAIEKEFIKNYEPMGKVVYGVFPEEERDIRKLRGKYLSDDWNFHQVKEYAVQMDKRFEWGNVEMTCELEGKIIREISIISDSLYPDLIDGITDGVNNGKDSIFSELKNICYDEYEVGIIEDIENMYQKFSAMIYDRGINK